MKVTVNIHDYLDGQFGPTVTVPASIDINDLLECADVPEEHEFDIDLDALLDEHRQVAVIWTIDHVQEVRPDLSGDQSWEVLKTSRARWGSCQWIDWQVIEKTAEELFGPKPERRWRGRIDVTITDTDGYGQSEVIHRLRDMADLLVKDMPSVEANAAEGTVQLLDPEEAASARWRQP
jgi:hypothetical protein